MSGRLVVTALEHPTRPHRWVRWADGTLLWVPCLAEWEVLAEMAAARVVVDDDGYDVLTLMCDVEETTAAARAGRSERTMGFGP